MKLRGTSIDRENILEIVRVTEVINDDLCEIFNNRIKCLESISSTQYPALALPHIKEYPECEEKNLQNKINNSLIAPKTKYSKFQLISIILTLYCVMPFKFPSILLISQLNILLITYAIISIYSIYALPTIWVPYRSISIGLFINHLLLYDGIYLLFNYIKYIPCIATFAPFAAPILIIMFLFFIATILFFSAIFYNLYFLIALRAMNYADTILIIILQITIYLIYPNPIVLFNIVPMIQYFIFVDCIKYFKQGLYDEIISIYLDIKNIDADKKNNLYSLGGKKILWFQVLFIIFKYAILWYYINIGIIMYILFILFCMDWKIYQALKSGIPLSLHYDDNEIIILCWSSITKLLN